MICIYTNRWVHVGRHVDVRVVINNTQETADKLEQCLCYQVTYCVQEYVHLCVCVSKTYVMRGKLNSQFIITAHMDFPKFQISDRYTVHWSPPPLLDLKHSNWRVCPMQ